MTNGNITMQWTIRTNIVCDGCKVHSHLSMSDFNIILYLIGFRGEAYLFLAVRNHLEIQVLSSNLDLALITGNLVIVANNLA